MLRWIVGIAISLMILIAAIGFGFYCYLILNANKKGTKAAAAYENYVERKLTRFCMDLVKRFPPNSDAQVEKACPCFADSMFGKVRDVPYEEVQAFAQQPEMQKKAQIIMEKCANQAGLFWAGTMTKYIDQSGLR